MSEPKKKVDSDWKKRAEEDKARLEAVAEQTEKKLEEAEGPLPPPTFLAFLANLELETRLALGEMKHPSTNEARKDLVAAQYLIDTIAMLQEKTKGNRDTREDLAIQNLLTELRFRFVEARKKVP